MLTDVVGSTRLWQDEPDAMSLAMRRHHEIVHEAVERHGGWRPPDQGEGDAVFAAFDSASAALTGATEVQQRLAAEQWPTSRPLQVRIAVHLGEVRERDGNLFGDPVNRCARIRSLASGGQTLVSSAIRELVRDGLPAHVQLTDLGEHRMKDLTRPERIWQVDVEGLPREFPPLASLDRAKHNLPLQLSSFVGRELDVRRLADLVQEHRLVTVTGFGGMGKTRIALQAAAETADGDGDGVWFVDLSSVTDAARVPAELTAVLGVGDAGAGAEAALLQWIADKRILLVIDNLEQIPESAAFIGRLLAAGDGIHVLATSRVRLRIRGEREFVLAPLGVPDSTSDRAEPGALQAFDAVRLFIDRALGARSDFEVTSANAPAVAAICARLDGHPLSIELAAARIRLLAPDALLTRLTSSLSLASRDIDRPDRQRTLRATIAWSYDLLGEEQRTVLDCLSVFPATGDLDAVESVIGPLIENGIDVVDALTDLVEASLVRVHSFRDEEGGSRYGLLVSIREFAAERLAERGLADHLIRRHAQHYVERSPLDHSVTPEAVAADRRWGERELANLRAALRHLQVDGTPEDEAIIAAAIVDITSDTDYSLNERIALHALDRNPSPSYSTFDLLTSLEVTAFYTGRIERARSLNARAQAAADALRSPAMKANSAVNRVWFGDSVEETIADIAAAEAAVAAVPEHATTPPKWILTTGLDMALAGNYAYIDPEKSLSAARRLAASTHYNPNPIAGPHNLALSLCDVGAFEEARAVLAPWEEAIEARDLTALRAIELRDVLGRVSVGLGDFDRAERYAADAVRIAEREMDALQAPRHVNGARLQLATCAFGRRDLSASAQLFSVALLAAQAEDDDLAAGRALWQLARVERLAGSANISRLDEAWAGLAGRSVRALPHLLGCLIERAIASVEHDPAESARLVAVVEAHRGPLVLPLAVADELPALLGRLRDSLGDQALATVLASESPSDFSSLS